MRDDSACSGNGCIVTPDEYIYSVAERLRAAGAEVGNEDLPSGVGLVGRRCQFRIRWLATKLNMFVVVRATETATPAELLRHANEALDYAVGQKGRFRGLQNGVAAIPVLVAPVVEPGAIEVATGQLIRRWAAFAWPTLVDCTSGRVYRHEGQVTIGGLYAKWMRQQIAETFPEPAL